MAVTLNKANLVLKDANGNIGKIEQLSSNDLAKIRTAVSDLALVVNQSNHTPIEATTTNKGVVQLATPADVVSGASDKVVTAEQLHNSTPATATSNTLGVVKPDNDTITIDSNGVLTATKAIRDKNGAQIDTTYFKSANGTFTGYDYYRNVSNSVLIFNGGNTRDGGASLMLYGKNANMSQGVFDLVACTKEDGSDTKQLIGTPAGALIWDNKHIVRSVNSVNADDNGNVQLGNIGAITGEIKWFAFNTVPDGYLVCNGASVSRTTYAALFAKIGTTFGSGDGSSTFTLPNLIDKFAQGSTTVGTVKSAGLPNITGYSNPFALNANGSGGYPLECNTSGAFYAFSEDYNCLKITNLEYIPHRKIGGFFSASRSNSIYGNSETVQPPALTLLPCIKY